MASPSGRSTPQPTTSSTSVRSWNVEDTNRRSTSVFHTMPAARGEDVAVDAEPDRRFVVRRRHEQALLRRDADAHHRRRVQVREEDEDVVLLVVAFEVLDERRASTAPAASATPSRPGGCAAT